MTAPSCLISSNRWRIRSCGRSGNGERSVMLGWPIAPSPASTWCSSTFAQGTRRPIPPHVPACLGAIKSPEGASPILPSARAVHARVDAVSFSEVAGELAGAKLIDVGLASRRFSVDRINFTRRAAGLPGRNQRSSASETTRDSRQFRRTCSVKWRYAPAPSCPRACCRHA